jgi:hypothetical protein
LDLSQEILGTKQVPALAGVYVVRSLKVQNSIVLGTKSKKIQYKIILDPGDKGGRAARTDYRVIVAFMSRDFSDTECFRVGPKFVSRPHAGAFDMGQRLGSRIRLSDNDAKRLDFCSGRSDYDLPSNQ